MSILAGRPGPLSLAIPLAYYGTTMARATKASLRPVSLTLVFPRYDVEALAFHSPHHFGRTQGTARIDAGRQLDPRLLSIRRWRTRCASSGCAGRSAHRRSLSDHL